MSLRDYLRARTRSAHERLDSQLALDSSDLTLERYTRFLFNMRAFVAGIEPALQSSELGQLGVDLSGRSKVRWLDEDLEWFGLEAEVAPPSALPRAVTPAEALGIAYVLEGSTLGGAALYEGIRARWDLAPGKGASYLFGHGTATGSMWRRFITMMDSAPLDEAQVEACAMAADATFSRLADWMELPRARS